MHTISEQTMGRGLTALNQGSMLESGADFHKENLLRTIVLSIISLGIYLKVSNDEIQEKTKSLSQISPGLATAILELKPDVQGRYTLHQTIEGREFLFNQEPGTNFISITDTSIQPGVSKQVHGVTFASLKKQLLIHCINSGRNNPERTDLRTMDLTGVDLAAIDFSNTLVNRTIVDALILVANPSLRGTSLALGNQMDANNQLNLADVKMDAESIASLAVAGQQSFRSVDLSQQNLKEGFFNGMQFTSANFTGAQLNGANFNCADLTNANISSANLTLTMLVNSNLTDVITDADSKFDETNMTRTVIDNATLSAHSHKQACISKEMAVEFIAQSRTLDDYRMDHQTEMQTNDWSEMDFNHVSLMRSNLSHLTLNGANFSGVNATAAKLNHCHMDAQTNLENTNLSQANFTMADLSEVTKVNAKTQLTAANFCMTKLSRELLELAIQQGVSIAGADLSGVDLSDLDLHGIDANNINFKGAIFNHTRLSTAGLSAAIKTRAQDVELDTNKFLEARKLDLRGLDMSGTADQLTDLSQLLRNNPDAGNFSLMYADLTGSDFSYCLFADADFTHTNLTRVKLTGTRLKHCTNTNLAIVSDADRKPYLISLKQRLYFIATGILPTADPDHPAIPPIEQDPFYQLSAKIIFNLRQNIFFNLTETTLTYGQTFSDGGPQNLIVQGKFDDRILTKVRGNPDQTKTLAEENLFKNKFSKEQKILFHWARAALWKSGLFQTVLDSSNMSQEFSDRAFNNIYIHSEIQKTRAPEGVMAAIFDIIAELKSTKLDLAPNEVAQVREFFLSPDYCW